MLANGGIFLHLLTAGCGPFLGGEAR
jgi:hypothetical protein